jgi:hypothetical protein
VSDKPPEPGTTLSERIERSPIGQLVISAAIVLVLLAEIGTHLPDSAIERSVGATANQVIHVFASEQSWGVFAPNPRSTSLELEGQVTFADGSTAVWTIPTGPRIGGNLRFYRWRKWLERVRSDDFRGTWDATARWIATLYDDRPSPVIRVQLVRYFRDNVVEGPQPPYDQFAFYTLELPPPGTAPSAEVAP